MNFSDRFDLSRPAWQRAARIGPVLAWALALSVTAWVAADLFWRFSAPARPALPASGLSEPQAAADAITSRHPMGLGRSGAPTAAPVAARYTLQAVVTGGDGRPGWAVLSADGGPQAGVVEGQEFQPGITLARVFADRVELSVGGASQSVPLSSRGNAGPGAVPLPAGQPPAVNVINTLPTLQAAGSSDTPTEIPDSGPRALPPGFPTQTAPNQ